MKKIYSLLTLFFLITTGCDDFLDRMNYTQMDESDVFKTVENAQGALTGVYDKLSDADFYGRHIYAYEAAKGPDFFVIHSSGNRFETENSYDETSAVSGYAGDIWHALYSTINATIKIIDGIDKAEGSDEEKARIKGEALALRGLAYFELMRSFAYPPIFSVPGHSKYNDKYKLGVPVVLTGEDLVQVQDEPRGRESAQYCYEEVIIKDLKAAKDLLKQYGRQDGKYLTYPAICALLSRVYLYMEDWSAAKDAAEEGIGATKATMIKYADYTNTYYKPFNSESIWELQYTETDNLSTDALNYLLRFPTIDRPGDPSDGTCPKELQVGYAAYGLQDGWMKLVKEIDGDVRTYLICESPKAKKNKCCRKYIGNPHYLHNIYMVRLPELYLNLAEACAEKDLLPDAANALNAVYEKRTNQKFTGPSNKADMIESILKERRKELVLEGHTYWDYFRRAIPFVREAKEDIDETKTHIDYTLPDLPQVVYPIPENEMDVNPIIREQQNPGYAAYIAS